MISPTGLVIVQQIRSAAARHSRRHTATYRTWTVPFSFPLRTYLSGEESLDEICVKFGIRQHSQLSSWFKVYNEGKKLKELTGDSAMKKARKTTLEERICIIKDCLDHDRNYGAMTLKYDCSYQRIRN